MKKILTLLFAAGLLTCTSYAVSALGDIDIQVNGSYIKTDAAPYIKNDRTLVPIRFVAEALGADSVVWDG